ncbi:argininosuccinate lyase [Paraburkholderia dipogonis]|uniref:argininosuccinate lyase n=2 Tax=Burkholderiaceae TaxID=119060 RepID=A0A4Y8MGY5_9BURK|nr:argininosuccinate lyase [Paraburkholderia dipogonis]
MPAYKNGQTGPLLRILMSTLSANTDNQRSDDGSCICPTYDSPAAQSIRDAFFWLGEINKASLVTNVRHGLLDEEVASRIAAALSEVVHNGEQTGGSRPDLVITFEPLLIEAGGVEVTLLHAGRSSQDMLATVAAAMYRGSLLDLARRLNSCALTLLNLATTYQDTIVPNYTNGVAAQPNSYGHYLLGHLAGIQRDLDRLRQMYARLDRSPMGTTVLNGTSWPLDRDAMANHLGFADVIENAYDAVQIAGAEIPVELGSHSMNVALHVAAFVQDVMVQYAQARPWIYLNEGDGNTYRSSSMPQKRNPGLLNDLRADASGILSLGIGRAIAAHNVPPGMSDGKRISENLAVVDGARRLVEKFQRALNALVIDADRALDEINSDWTASQEIADVLMRKHKLPFRLGHHFASELVATAKNEGIRPNDFPYERAARIYQEMLDDANDQARLFPMDETEFRAALDPAAIVANRATKGGPQPGEMQRMLAAHAKELTETTQWINDRSRVIETSLRDLNRLFLDCLSKAGAWPIKLEP